MTWPTVDGRIPAPADIVNILLFIYRVLYIPGGAGFLPPTVWWWIYITFVESLRIYVIYVSYWSVECQIHNQKAKYNSLSTSKRRIVFFFNPQKSQTIGCYQTSLFFNVCFFVFFATATPATKWPKPKMFKREAWSRYHNQVHHYRVNEPDGDPEPW